VLALSLSAAVAQAQKKKSQKYSYVTLYSKYTRALTFQNLCDSPCRRPFFFLRRQIFILMLIKEFGALLFATVMTTRQVKVGLFCQ
jgi:hypothetical protein